MESIEVRTDYYEDWPDHATRLEAPVTYVKAFKNNRVILMITIENSDYFNELVKDKHLNLVFTQVVNTRIFFRKSYSFTLEQIKKENYWLSVVYLSIEENYAIDKIFSKEANILDYMTILLTDKAVKTEEQILRSLNDLDSVIYEERTPFVFEVDDHYE